MPCCTYARRPPSLAAFYQWRANQMREARDGWDPALHGSEIKRTLDLARDAEGGDSQSANY